MKKISRYLPWLSTGVMACHSYYVYLSARHSKDALLQAVASVGLLSAVLLLLALILRRYYRRTATVLVVAVSVMLLLTLLKSYLWSPAFWLMLAGFAWLIPVFVKPRRGADEAC